jgi:stage III sporulation protein AG
MSERNTEGAKAKLPSRSEILLIIGIAAGLLMIFMGNLPQKKSPSPAPSETEMTDSYIRTLESRLTLILEAMDGISEVKVIITPESTVQTLYATDLRYDGGALTSKEYVMSDEEGMPVILSLVYPKIRGVAVVCRGGGDPVRAQKMIDLISALLDLRSSSVCVVS